MIDRWGEYRASSRDDLRLTHVSNFRSNDDVTGKNDDRHDSMKKFWSMKSRLALDSLRFYKCDLLILMGKNTKTQTFKLCWWKDLCHSCLAWLCLPSQVEENYQWTVQSAIIDAIMLPKRETKMSPGLTTIWGTYRFCRRANRGYLFNRDFSW